MTFRGRAIRALSPVLLGLAILDVATVLTATAVFLAQSAANAGPGGVEWRNPGPWVDWRTYANAVDRMLAGQAIFAPEQLAGPYQLTHVVLIGYAYPPPSVVLFLPFASYPLGLAAFLTLNLGLFLSAVWAIISLAWPRYRVALFALVLASLGTSIPFISGVVSANVNVGMAGLVGWLALGRLDRVAWAAGGFGALVKIMPGVVAAGGTRKRRDVALAIGLIAGVTLVTLPLTGLGAWTDWVRALVGAQPDCYPGNQSIACVLGLALGTLTATWLGYGVAAIAALAMLFVRDSLWLAVLAAIAIMAPTTTLHPHFWLIADVVGLAALARLTAVMTERRKRARENGPLRSPAPTLPLELS